MAISDSPTTRDASVLAQILAALNVLPVLRNEVRLAEFMTQLLQEIPGVASSGCCIRGLPEPTGHFKGGPCGQCPVRQRGQQPEEATCELARDKVKALPIATGDTFCGFLLVSIANAMEYQPYEPFLVNLANSTAFALENRWQKAELLELNATLRASEERLRTVVEQAGDALFLIEPSGKFVEVNQRACDALGYTREELLGLSVPDINPVFPREKFAEFFRTLDIGRPVTVDAIHRRKDGTTFPVEIRTALIEIRGETHLLSFARDVTERRQAEEAIEGLAKFPSENPNPVLRVAHDGLVIYANEASRPLLDALGRQEGDCLPDEWLQHVVDVAGSNTVKRVEFECKDRVFALRFTPVVDAGYVNVYALDITERKHAEEALRESEEHLRKVHAQLEEKVKERTADLSLANIELMEEIAARRRLEREILKVSDSEQRRIGRDLHDGLGQHLAGLAFKCESLAQTLAELDLPQAAAAEGIEKLVREAISQTRHLARGLSPEFLEVYGLTRALQELAAAVADVFGIRCDFVYGSPINLEDNTAAVHLYRIAQEALNNAAKHGKAENITLTLTRSGEQTVLTVKDNGIGFSPTSRRQGGMGLRIMDYRARMIDGVCEIQSAPGEGTIVTCSCRLEKPHHTEPPGVGGERHG